jgi:hypothetical protein
MVIDIYMTTFPVDLLRFNVNALWRKVKSYYHQWTPTIKETSMDAHDKRDLAALLSFRKSENPSHRVHMACSATGQRRTRIAYARGLAFAVDYTPEE